MMIEKIDSEKSKEEEFGELKSKKWVEKRVKKEKGMEEKGREKEKERREKGRKREWG